MNKRPDQARIVIDVEKATHKKLKTMAINEDKSLKALMLESIQWLLKERNKKSITK